jgi:hypothetical protein
MADIEYVPVTDIEVGDRIFTAYSDHTFVVTSVEEVEGDWAGEKPIPLETFIEIIFDAEADLTFRFRKGESIWRYK